jgi:hypothetical protein
MQPLLAAFEDRDRRLQSFVLCNQLKTRHITELVNQGFVYIRFDLCVCYSCCTNINIASTDEEFDFESLEALHATANPFCAHLFMYKGSDFILGETAGEPLADVTSECLTLIPGDMWNASERRKSFTACRDRNRLLLHEIVENGFYYCAENKQYVCFNCDTTYNSISHFTKVRDLQMAHASKAGFCRLGHFALGRTSVGRLSHGGSSPHTCSPSPL